MSEETKMTPEEIIQKYRVAWEVGDPLGAIKEATRQAYEECLNIAKNYPFPCFQGDGSRVCPEYIADAIELRLQQLEEGEGE